MRFAKERERSSGVGYTTRVAICVRAAGEERGGLSAQSGGLGAGRDVFPSDICGGGHVICGYVECTRFRGFAFSGVFFRPVLRAICCHLQALVLCCVCSCAPRNGAHISFGPCRVCELPFVYRAVWLKVACGMRDACAWRRGCNATLLAFRVLCNVYI